MKPNTPATTQPEQMTFNWPSSIALGPDDFFISPANERAYTLLMSPQNWPEGKLILIGPERSGKSHLIGIWQNQYAGQVHSADILSQVPLQDGPLIIEDLHRLKSEDQEHLFHLHNHAKNTGQFLLMTARTPPVQWGLSLPDLSSRLQASTDVRIDDPDDALLSVLILKLFRDRQMSPPPQVVQYLSQRLERSFSAITQAVEKLDRITLQEKKPLSLSLVSRLFAQPNTP